MIYLYEKEKRHFEVTVSDKKNSPFIINEATFQILCDNEVIIEETPCRIVEHTLVIPIGPLKCGMYRVEIKIEVAGDIIIKKVYLKVRR